jgi:hypothetical protein
MLFFLAAVSGCASGPKTVFSFQGWNQQNPSGNSLVTTGKLYGTVGVPFTTATLKAMAIAPDGSGAHYSWNNSAFVFGKLPPGLTWGTNTSIVGTPTTAGDWNFAARYTGIQCNGENFPDQVIYCEIIIYQ